MTEEKSIDDLPAGRPCKRIRRARAAVEGRLSEEYYKQQESQEAHRNGSYRASPKLAAEKARMATERAAADRARWNKEQRTKEMLYLRRHGKMAGLDDFGTGPEETPKTPSTED
jgi:hypothetical protein